MQIVRWLAAAAVVALGVLAAQLGLRSPGEHGPALVVPTAAAAPARTPAPPGPNKPAAAAAKTTHRLPGDLASELGVKLVGVVIASAPQDSSAVIEEADGSRHSRAPGEAIAGGRARIESISAELVAVVDASGRRALLLLESGAGKRAAPMPPRSAKELFEMSSEELEKLQRKDEKQLAVDLETALRDLESSLLLSAGPGRRGVRIEQRGPQSPLAQLGLVPGDVILSVDGAAVNSARDGMEGLARSLYSVGGSTLLTVLRADGSRVQIATGSGMALPQEPTSEIRRR